MMVRPTREEDKMFKILDSWMIAEGNKYILKNGAPKEAQEMYEVYKQKYGIEV